MTTCKQCPKEYKPHRGKVGGFCSRTCYWESKKGVVPLGGKISGSHKGKRHTEEWKEKMRKLMKENPTSSSFKFGEAHPKWIKDRNLLSKRQERNDMAYKEWRKQVWLRDRFTCRIADNKCDGRIEAHHILGWSEHPELRYQINNGITLCHAHHPRARAEEKRLIPTFMDLVSVSN